MDTSVARHFTALCKDEVFQETIEFIKNCSGSHDNSLDCNDVLSSYHVALIEISNVTILQDTNCLLDIYDFEASVKNLVVGSHGEHGLDDMLNDLIDANKIVAKITSHGKEDIAKKVQPWLITRVWMKYFLHQQDRVLFARGSWDILEKSSDGGIRITSVPERKRQTSSGQDTVGDYRADFKLNPGALAGYNLLLESQQQTNIDMVYYLRSRFALLNLLRLWAEYNDKYISSIDLSTAQDGRAVENACLAKNGANIANRCLETIQSIAVSNAAGSIGSLISKTLESIKGLKDLELNLIEKIMQLPPQLGGLPILDLCRLQDNEGVLAGVEWDAVFQACRHGEQQKMSSEINAAQFESLKSSEEAAKDLNAVVSYLRELYKLEDEQPSADTTVPLTKSMNVSRPAAVRFFLATTAAEQAQKRVMEYKGLQNNEGFEEWIAAYQVEEIQRITAVEAHFSPKQQAINAAVLAVKENHAGMLVQARGHDHRMDAQQLGGEEESQRLQLLALLKAVITVKQLMRTAVIALRYKNTYIANLGTYLHREYANKMGSESSITLGGRMSPALDEFLATPQAQQSVAELMSCTTEDYIALMAKCQKQASIYVDQRLIRAHNRDLDTEQLDWSERMLSCIKQLLPTSAESKIIGSAVVTAEQLKQKWYSQRLEVYVLEALTNAEKDVVAHHQAADIKAAQHNLQNRKQASSTNYRQSGESEDSTGVAEQEEQKRQELIGSIGRTQDTAASSGQPSAIAAQSDIQPGLLKSMGRICTALMPSSWRRVDVSTVPGDGRMDQQGATVIPVLRKYQLARHAMRASVGLLVMMLAPLYAVAGATLAAIELVHASLLLRQNQSRVEERSRTAVGLAAQGKRWLSRVFNASEQGLSPAHALVGVALLLQLEVLSVIGVMSVLFTSLVAYCFQQPLQRFYQRACDAKAAVALRDFTGKCWTLATKKAVALRGWCQGAQQSLQVRLDQGLWARGSRPQRSAGMQAFATAGAAGLADDNMFTSASLSNQSVFTRIATNSASLYRGLGATITRAFG